MPTAASLRTALIACANRRTGDEFVDHLPPKVLRRLCWDWDAWARPDQRPPIEPWQRWMLMGGRGCGKTRAGAEWVRGAVEGRPRYAVEAAGRIALVGETFADAREVMVEGVSGIIASAPPWNRPRYEATRKRLLWDNGAVARLYSAEDPESLRGSQFDAAWCDEVGKWRQAEEAFDQLALGLRLGAAPRCVITTTPRPTKLIKRLVADPACTVTRAQTLANRAFLAPGFIDGLEAAYGGSRLYRQEVEGDLIEDRADSLWKRSDIEEHRLPVAPDLGRIVVAVDPPASAHGKSDACGIIAAGSAGQGRYAVLADASLQGAKPEGWARAAVSLYRSLNADCILAEANQGGEMVRAVLAQAGPDVPVKLTHASRGKWTRAEPVALLYAQGRVAHIGTFAALEDEMLDFGPDGLSDKGASPDRLDALVWALTELTGANLAPPRLRTLA